MGQAIARSLNAEHCDDQGPSLPCECGYTARYAGRRAKTFLTVLGSITLERAWYHCEHCHRGFSPRDRALGLEGTSLSPAALRMTGLSAAWIWNLADEHFPGAVQIIDIFHAKGHLFEVAKALYGPGTDLAAQWGKQRRDELDQGRIDALLAALRPHVETCEEAGRCIGYIARNRHRMPYPTFRAMGLCGATGVVEAGGRTIVAACLERCGMHWTVHGTNAIIALRCSSLSNRFDDFWERRALAA